MLPVIVLVGQPNVGKSTLFNLVTKSRDALVGELPGLTRDRLYGTGTIDHKEFIIVDTGGIEKLPKDKIKKTTDNIGQIMSIHSRKAIDEADAVIFMIDGRSGINTNDFELAKGLRKLEKPVYLVANKTEGLDHDVIVSSYFEIGLGQPRLISAERGSGVKQLFRELLSEFPVETLAKEEPDVPQIAIVGRPNVGKSTLTNSIFGEERVVVFDKPGTTRDSISIPFEYDNQNYILVDTAGVRRKSRIRDLTEKYSVIKTLRAIESANVVVLVLDAKEGISDQDTTLAGYILEQGKAIVVVVNKCDAITVDEKRRIELEIDRKLPFLNYACVLYISAKKKTGLMTLLRAVMRAFDSARRNLPTRKLNQFLDRAISETQPPMVHGRRIKLKYAHQGGKNPPLIVIHGNQVKSVPSSYRRYLANVFRRGFDLEGTPVKIVFKQGENPYQGRKNKPSTRQQDQRRRQKRRSRKKYA